MAFSYVKLKVDDLENEPSQYDGLFVLRYESRRDGLRPVVGVRVGWSLHHFLGDGGGSRFQASGGTIGLDVGTEADFTDALGWGITASARYLRMGEFKASSRTLAGSSGSGFRIGLAGSLIIL